MTWHGISRIDRGPCAACRSSIVKPGRRTDQAVRRERYTSGQCKSGKRKDDPLSICHVLGIARQTAHYPARRQAPDFIDASTTRRCCNRSARSRTAGRRTVIGACGRYGESPLSRGLQPQTRPHLSRRSGSRSRPTHDQEPVRPLAGSSCRNLGDASGATPATQCAPNRGTAIPRTTVIV